MQKKNSRLGSGIDALLGSLDTGAENTATLVTMVDMSLIVVNENQPRQIFHEETLKELAQSICDQGVLQPILLENFQQGYRIVAGERRFRASKLAGLGEIPALVRTFTDEERLVVSLLENIQRENISPLEEAQAYKELMDVAQLNQQELSDRLGKSRSAVANTLRLLNLPEELKEAVSQGQLSAGHARTLLAVQDEEEQKKIFDEVQDKKMSVRELEQRIQRDQPVTKTTEKQEYVSKAKKVQILLEKKIGVDVIVKINKNKGSIQLNFQDENTLNRILSYMKISLDDL